MCLQKCNKLSVIQCSCPDEIDYFSYSIRNLIHFYHWLTLHVMLYDTVQKYQFLFLVNFILHLLQKQIWTAIVCNISLFVPLQSLPLQSCLSLNTFLIAPLSTFQLKIQISCKGVERLLILLGEWHILNCSFPLRCKRIHQTFTDKLPIRVWITVLAILLEVKIKNWMIKDC